MRSATIAAAATAWLNTSSPVCGSFLSRYSSRASANAFSSIAMSSGATELDSCASQRPGSAASASVSATDRTTETMV
ncbi:hypothetical protein D3C85_1694940 [compost metagenome]